MADKVRSVLEVVPNESRGRHYEVNISCPEFTAFCPKTGQPDFATIHIKYVPDRLLVELKSLKLYLAGYRSVGIFHEHVTNRILDDFVTACKPMRCEVVGDFNVRGGIKTIVRAAYERNRKARKPRRR
ncbi:MAG: NADPH-dependent 7-cyano-7-deazaguanine reductase QueF [Acidobacteria bacterium]|nr:NADPH-dependent 7-cyano-7-deazaguanine reductase QueF [Acidobacteriota bacterium]